MLLSATPTTQSESRRHQAPLVPRKVKVVVTKYHACHANSHGARQTQARHQSQPSAKSATPATQSEGPCRQVPRLPRTVKVDVTKRQACHRDPSAPPEPAQCRKCHACPAECHACQAKWVDVTMWPCKQPRRPRRPLGTKRASRCRKSHACHANWRSMSPKLPFAWQSWRLRHLVHFVVLAHASDDGVMVNGACCGMYLWKRIVWKESRTSCCGCISV